MEITNLQYVDDTIQLRKQIEVSFLSLGERLLRIRDEKLYAGRYDNFEEFLEEAKLSPSAASKLINIYQRFFLEWGFKAEELVGAGGWSVVSVLLPVCKTKSEAKEWMDKAQVLSRQDLERDIKELKTGIDSRDCKHEDSYTITICRSCGNRARQYEEDPS